MGRTKIDIDITALGLRTKQMSLIVGSNTAASDVISKVLEKLRMQDHPSTFQLFAMEQDSESESMFVLFSESVFVTDTRTQDTIDPFPILVAMPIMKC